MRSRRLHLPKSYYLDDDVVYLARDLIGKKLCTLREGVLTSGIITETEAYRGPEDRASHAFQGRCTPRNAVMYGEGGVAYVYLCYGIHSLFNIVTNVAGIPHAVLIRAIHPVEGVEKMVQRRGKKSKLTDGPGTVSQALGIDKSFNGLDLTGDRIWLEPGLSMSHIIASRRIGIDYAGEDALLPWRFYTQMHSKVGRGAARKSPRL